MPRYFFDVTDTGDTSRDGQGVEFPSLKEARAEALRTLGEIVKDELPDGDHRHFVIGYARQAVRLSSVRRFRCALKRTSQIQTDAYVSERTRRWL
jgi:hypothetical protein